MATILVSGMTRQARNFPGFKYHIIERPYFGMFMYKILFRGADVNDNPIRRNWVNSMLPKSQIFELQKYRKLHALIRDRARELSGDKDFRFRQDSGLNVYLYNQACVKNLATEFKDHVIGIWGPLDDAHQQHAMASPKIRTRKILWKGRYRYRVVLHPEPEHSVGLARIFEELVLGEDYDVNRSLEDFITIGHPSSVFSWQSGEKLLYCNDEQLIMMISLSCTDAVHKIDKVITHNELSQQEKIATQDAREKPGNQA